MNSLIDPINNISIRENFPLKLSGIGIEIDKEYSAKSKKHFLF